MGKVYCYWVLGLSHDGGQCARFSFTGGWVSAMKGSSVQGLLVLGVICLSHEGGKWARFIFTGCWVSAMKGGSGQGLVSLGVGSLT